MANTDPRVSQAMALVHALSLASTAADVLDAERELHEYLAAEFAKVPCIASDPRCPCNDGDTCNYVATKKTPAFEVPSAPVEAVPQDVSPEGLYRVINEDDGLLSLHFRTEDEAVVFMGRLQPTVEIDEKLELQIALATTPPQAEPSPTGDKPLTPFLVKTNTECRQWMEGYYVPEAIEKNFLLSLWAWQEQERRYARLTAELSDEKAEVERLTFEVRERLQKQQAAEAELREVRKDADRYRKWRDTYASADNTDDVSDADTMLGALANAWTPEAVDQAIDAAMTKEKPHGRPE